MEKNMNNLVVQSNVLLNGVPVMKTGAFKIFLKAVTQVKQNEDTSSRDVTLDFGEVSQILTATNNNARRYRVLDSIKRLLSDSVFHIKIYDEHKGREVDKFYAPISTAEVDGNELTITFSAEIMPYISNLNKNFTKYDVQNIYHLGTNSSISIYQLLRSSLNKVIYSNKLSKEEKNRLLNPIFELDFLKNLTNCSNKYPVFKDYERRILKPSIDLINENTDLEVSYGKIKNGRSIGAIQFFLKEKKSSKIDVKMNDVVSLKNNDDNYDKIINSPYLNKLIGSQLLNPVDIMDKDKILSLETLFEKYADFEKKFDKNKLEQHLRFVKKNMSENVNELAEYLVKCLENYIDLLNSGVDKKQVKQRKKVVEKEKLPDWALDKANKKHSKIPVDEKVAREQSEKIKELLKKTK